MTYNGGPSRVTNNVMKVLVIVTIVWVGYWAATGGLDQIATPGNGAVDDIDHSRRIIPDSLSVAGHSLGAYERQGDLETARERLGAG